MKAPRLVLICAIVLTFFATAPAADARPAPRELSSGCQDLNTRVFTALNGFGSYFSFFAGDTLTIIGRTPAMFGTASTISLWVDAIQVDTAGFPGTLTYTFPADVTAVYVFWGADHDNVTWTSSCTGGASALNLAPGCDLGMPISSTSVVGRFLIPIEAYWAPGQPDTRVITLPAGQSAWVLGRDESGAYYRIVWSCDLLWVPVEAMGPNYDALWQGWPLPTGVVK